MAHAKYQGRFAQQDKREIGAGESEIECWSAVTGNKCHDRGVERHAATSPAFTRPWKPWSAALEALRFEERENVWTTPMPPACPVEHHALSPTWRIRYSRSFRLLFSKRRRSRCLRTGQTGNGDIVV